DLGSVVCLFPVLSRSSSWSRPALVMVLYLGLGAAALVWGGLRDEPNVWRLPGRAEPAVLAGIASGLAAGLSVGVVARVALSPVEWARLLPREFRHLRNPLADFEIVILAAASSVGEEMFFRGALLPSIGLLGSSAVFALLHIGPRSRYLPWTASSF